jgi:hypothetical protein
MSERLCKTCQINHPIDDFETYKINGEVRYRMECKKARKERRQASVKAAPAIDPNTVPLPSQCVKCGEKPPQAEFKWRSDVKKGGWRTACNRCSDVNSNGVSHSQAYRKREMDKDAKAYRARNAKMHLDWAHRNPDKVQAQQLLSAADPTRRFKAVLTYIRQKYGGDDSTIEKFVEMIDAPLMEAKMLTPCHYCGHKPGENEKLNGLDRVDPSGKYTDVNTVACCGVCNSMKLTFSVDEFLNGVRDIVRYRRLDTTNYNVSRPPAFGGTAERCNITKNKENNLSKEINIRLWAGECYMCGRGPSLGIDRVDSTKDYSIENCKSCCTLCNYMKKDWTLDEFLGHVSRVYNHTQMWMLGDTLNTLNCVMGPRRPIAAFDRDDKMLIVFPSVSAAATLVGVSSKTIQTAIPRNVKICGANWHYTDVSTYKQQYLVPDEAFTIIQNLRNARRKNDS